MLNESCDGIFCYFSECIPVFKRCPNHDVYCSKDIVMVMIIVS